MEEGVFDLKCHFISFLINPFILSSLFLFAGNETTQVKRKYLLFQTLNTVITDRGTGVALR